MKGGAEGVCSNSKREWTSQPHAASFGREAWASKRVDSRVRAHRGEACKAQPANCVIALASCSWSARMCCRSLRMRTCYT